ncbi:MAG: hypothetical protein C0392_05640 [Syntrophus sp. (in: bacteria)]|nr:hypothetical protein [Syntrophus sp. (in: bacteria)]
MENSSRNIINAGAAAPKKVRTSEENRPGNRFASSQNIIVTTSGYAVQEPNSLFAEIDGTNNVHETPQTIIARRYYEAALKVFQAGDQITGSMLNIVA